MLRIPIDSVNQSGYFDDGFQLTIDDGDGFFNGIFLPYQGLWHVAFLDVTDIPTILTDFEVGRVFTFTDHELVELTTRRTAWLTVAAAIQLGFLKLCGRTLVPHHHAPNHPPLLRGARRSARRLEPCRQYHHLVEHGLHGYGVEATLPTRLSIQPEDMARLSPLGFDHINLLGRDAFSVPDSVIRGELRPLRNPADPLDDVA